MDRSTDRSIDNGSQLAVAAPLHVATHVLPNKLRPIIATFIPDGCQALRQEKTSA